MELPRSQSEPIEKAKESSLLSENQEVTVMFVDVVNSTAVFENIDPEYVHQIMNGCFKILIDEVHQYKGSINQFRGDCAMAIFEPLDVPGNHAARACQAALGIISAMKEYGNAVHRRHNIVFQVRIGLNTGPVVIGAIGEALQMDFVADGDTTHLAAGLESRAKPGTILISSDTRKLLDPSFNLKSIGKLHIKEEGGALVAYELVGEKISTRKNDIYTHSPPESYTPKHLADKILTTRSSLEGERKHVTVMFVDVADAKAVFENVDPESVHRIMNGWFDILLDQIHKYEGIINQFRGDRVMAIFGAPIAHEDHAPRACYAALGIMRAVTDYGKKIENEYKRYLQVRIGLNTGQVVVGSIGNDLRMDYTADGDTSNLAARMQTHAEPGTTLISPNTYNRVGQLFKLTSRGEIFVKGKKQPVAVYVLTGEKVYRPRLGMERHIYSELVGRSRELGQLNHQVQKLMDGSGAVVSIIGEAGIGKSRLVAELMNPDIMNRVTLLEGKAISIGTTLSFFPIIDLLKNWAGIGQEDDKATAFNKLETAVQNLHPEQSDEITPFIATLMGFELTGSYATRVQGIAGDALETLIYKNFRELIIRATTSGPLVVMMEDLHWADLSSIGFLESIFRLARSHPILFINQIRPGYEKTGERLVKALMEDLTPYYLEISLSPLDAVSSEALIHNMLKIGGFPTALIHQIVTRSDGNPYFIEEVVRSFIDEGALVVKDGCFETTDKIHQMLIPGTINDLLTARIDRLEEKNRELVKTASVIGRTFFYRILRSVAESGQDIDQRLAYLKTIQMIFERQRLEEIEYLFTHALAQEAAYASILLEKRKPLHLKVAHSIEKLFLNNLHDFYGILSYHYINGEDLYKAEEYLLKSGEEALKSSASSEAITFFTEALRLYQDRLGKTADPGKIAYMEKCIGVGYYNKGQLVESIPYLRNVLKHYGIKESKNAVYGSIKALLCFMLFLLRLYIPFLKKNKIPTEKESEIIYLWFKHSTALAVSDKVAFLKESIRFMAMLLNYRIKSVENGAGYALSSSVLFSYGGVSFSLARKILNTVKKELDDNDVKGLIYYGVSKHILDFLSGSFKKEGMFDEKLVTQNLKLGEVVFTTFYINQFIFQNIERGSFKNTIKLIEMEFEIIETYRCDFSLSLLLYLHARVLLKMRKLKEAIVIAEQGIAQANKTGDITVLGQTYAIKARMHILTGELGKAETCLENAEKIRPDALLPFYLVEVHLSRFILEVFRLIHIPQHNSQYSRKNRRKVLKCGQKTARIAKKTVYNSVELYRYMGIYYWQANKHNKAFKYWGKSIEKGEYMGAKPELARTYFEVGKHLLDKTSKQKEFNGLSAKEYIGKAKNMFEEMSLDWDLDELAKMTKHFEVTGSQ